jgi:hypothetical protein
MAQLRTGSSNFSPANLGMGSAADSAGLANLKKVFDAEKGGKPRAMQTTGSVRPLGDLPATGRMQIIASTSAGSKADYRSEADRADALDAKVSLRPRPGLPTAESASSHINNMSLRVQTAAAGVSGDVGDVMRNYATDIARIGTRVANGRRNPTDGMDAADGKVREMNNRLGLYGNGVNRGIGIFGL